MYMYDFQFFILNNIYCKFLIQENKKKTEDDRDMMNQEKTGLEKEIKQWEAQFKKKNGREPTEEDKYERLQSQGLNHYIHVFWLHLKSVWWIWLMK